MADNSAARANFEELKGHITLASKRIKALEPGTDAYNQSLEDLEDYYERTIQLRKLQADTALEERNETIKKFKMTALFYNLFVLLLFVVIGGQFVWFAPDIAADAFKTVIPYITLDRIILIILILFIGSKSKKSN